MTTECLSNPCKNNAHCQTTPAGSVKCHCQKGYKGLYCEKGIWHYFILVEFFANFASYVSIKENMKINLINLAIEISVNRIVK